MNGRRWLAWGLLGLVGLLAVIQAIPYGRQHDNPPVIAEPAWDAPVTRALAVRACYDCHSNETVWPWYSNVAPVSWLVARDVAEGREKLNFSQWDSSEEGEDVVETIQEGEMPPVYFKWAHSSARLTDAETRQLIAGLQTTIGSR